MLHPYLGCNIYSICLLLPPQIFSPHLLSLPTPPHHSFTDPWESMNYNYRRLLWLTTCSSWWTTRALVSAPGSSWMLPVSVAVCPSLRYEKAVTERQSSGAWDCTPQSVIVSAMLYRLLEKKNNKWTFFFLSAINVHLIFYFVKVNLSFESVGMFVLPPHYQNSPIFMYCVLQSCQVS